MDNEDDKTDVSDGEGEGAASDSNYPKWVPKLLEHFEFVEKIKKRSTEGGRTRERDVCTLRCTICKSAPAPTAKPKGKRSSTQRTDPIVTGCNSSPFNRHLQRLHKDIVAPTSTAGSGKRKREDEDYSIPSVEPSVIGSGSCALKEAKKYDINGPKQKLFHKQLLDCITTDGLPFSAVEKPGFKKLIRSIDPRLTCPSRWAIKRSLMSKHKQIRNHLKTKLKSLEPGSAHLILDIWSSRQKMSVIGVQVRYIKDWKIHQHLIGFKHFPGAHDADSIRKKIDDLLNSYGLKISDFLTVTADNASAILAAFKESSLIAAVTTTHTHDEIAFVDGKQTGEAAVTIPSESQPTHSNENINVDGDWEDIEEQDELLDGGSENIPEIEREFIGNVEIDSIIDSVISNWGLEGQSNSVLVLRRNSCLAHLLQLAIKDALRNPDVCGLLKKVNNIITWFHKSNKFYTSLKERAGVGLVSPCETRWNSTYFSLNRLMKEVKIKKGAECAVPLTVATVVNTILAEARKLPAKKVPPALSECNIATIRVMVDLLEPFATLTDSWQGDGLTSSSVILALDDSIKALDEVEIDDSLEDRDRDMLAKFKEDIRSSVITRFTTPSGRSKTLTQNDNSKQRSIVTTDVMNDKLYLLAAVLNPRIKTKLFEDGFKFGFTPNNGIPLRSDVVKILKAAFREEETISVSEVEVLENASCSSGSQREETSIDNLSAKGTPPLKKKKKRDMYERLEEHQDKASTKDKAAEEVDQYLSSDRSKEKPLQYWRNNQERFPVLSRIAMKILAMPSTSASVERLFSVAGAIISCRRASMKIETAEELLLYKEYLRTGILDI